MAPRAENKMGRWGATSYIVGNIIGSGIFIAPSSILKCTNSVGLSLLVWLLSAAIATLGAYCYLELGTSIRRSGGDFAYLCHVRWNAIAFSFMAIGCVLIYPLMLAIQAETLAEYAIQGLQPCLDKNSGQMFFFRKLISFSCIWALLFLNFFSVRRVVARFQIATSIAKLLATAVIVGIGFYLMICKGQTQNLRQPFANSTLLPGDLVNAFFAGLFSYDGWDVLFFGVEEVKNPRGTMFFAILVGMACVTAVYAAINISYFAVLTVKEVASSTAVAMTFAEHSLGSFSVLMPFLINLVMIGSINGTMFTASRYLFAAARERQLPSFIALTNTEHDSPRAALLIHVLLSFLFSFVGNVDQLINYLGFAQWLQRAFTMAALLWIRLGPPGITKLSIHPDAIRTPLILPCIFLFVCSALVLVTLVQDFGTAYIGLLVLVGGFIAYALFIWESSLSRFARYREWTAIQNDWLARAAQIALNGQIEISSAADNNDSNLLEDNEAMFDSGRAATLSISHVHDSDNGNNNHNNKVFPAADTPDQQRRRRRRTTTKTSGNSRKRDEEDKTQESSNRIGIGA